MYMGTTGSKIYAVPSEDTVLNKEVYEDIFMWYNFKSESFDINKQLKSMEEPYSMHFAQALSPISMKGDGTFITNF